MSELSKWCEASLTDRICRMNQLFNLPTNALLTDQGNERLSTFENIMHKELTELDDVRRMKPGLDRFVAMADLLGDIIVYTMSEAERWGIPVIEVVHMIMDSQDTKLVDGKPVMSPDGSKFDKGPNYVPPEAMIRQLLEPLLRISNEQNT